MAMLSNVVGLDLGSHSLKAVEFRQTLRGFEAVALRMLPRTGHDGDTAELIRHFAAMHRLSTEHIVAALPGNRVSSRRMAFPFRDRKKLAQAIPFEVEDDSLFELENVLVDWEVVGGDRSRSEVVATIATRDEVSGMLSMLDDGGCEPRTLEAEGLVLGNLASLFELEGTRLLVDLGHQKTTCCLMSGGRPVAARTFPVAGDALTRAIARDRGSSLEEAERYKCETGVFESGLGGAAPAAAAVLDRIAKELVRTIGALETVIAPLDTGPLSEITLCGGTAQLERLDAYLSDATRYSAQCLGLPRPGHGDSLTAGGSPLAFAPAIALALRGTAQAKTRMNFRQDEFAVRLDLGRYRRDFAWTSGLAALAAVLAVISIGTATALEGRRAGRVEQEIARLYAQVFPGRPVAGNAISQLRGEVQSAGERADFLGVYRGNLSALDLLEEISRRVPADLDLILEELNIDRQVIRMRVYAKSFEAADRLGAELGKFPPFAQVRIGAIERDKKRGGMRFNVTINLASPSSSGDA
jgi:type IV pilus assembly protein PilM